jgi:hypothetical protein
VSETKISPTPKQIEAHRKLQDNQIVLYGGAIRGGKSYWLLIELLTLCFKHPRSRWLILRASYTNIERTILVSFNELMGVGFNQYLKTFDRNTMTATFNNGSQILFMAESFDSDKELNRFRGLEINGGGIDEINEIQQATFNKVIERSGSWNGCRAPIKILCTCNPNKGWVKELFYDRFQNGTLPPGWAYIPAKLTDNPYLNPEYVESLKNNMPPFEYQVFVEGNWDIQQRTGSEFYKYFSIDKHTAKVHYNPELPLHLSWDENVNPYLPCGVFQISGMQIRFIDLFLGRNPRNTIKDVCADIKLKYRGHSAGMFIYGDATSQKADVKQQKGYNLFTIILNELKEFNPQKRVPASNPALVPRGQFINSVLYNQFDGIEFLISHELKDAINDFILTAEAPDGTKAKQVVKDPVSGVSYQPNGHITDLTDYIVCYAFSKSFSKFQKGSVSDFWGSVGKSAHNTRVRL